jgi:phytoene synthase
MDDTSRLIPETVRAADPDRYVSALYAPEDKRGALLSLYAFNAEIAGVRDRIREALPGEVRLQWWRDVVAAGAAEDRSPEAGAGAGHPLARALVATIAAYDLPREAFDNYLEARIFDLYDDPMPSRTDLEGYCGETASALIQLAALVLDPGNAPRFAELAGHAGCAQAICGLLLLLPRHRARGQCFVPADILAAAGSSSEECLAGDGGPAAGRVVAAMVALARDHLAAFGKGASSLPPSLRPAFLPLALTGAYLDRIERLGPAALAETPHLPLWLRHWLIFRRATKGW